MICMYTSIVHGTGVLISFEILHGRRRPPAASRTAAQNGGGAVQL